MGGLFVNYFNRFGRQWQVYVEAEGEYRTEAEKRRPVLRAQSNNEIGAARRADDDEARSPDPEFTMRYNVYRSAQINGSAAPGYSSAQAMAALEEIFAETMPREMGYDYIGHVVPGEEGAEGVPPIGDLRLLTAVCLPDSRRAV